jgi:hypothetical protein
MFQIFEGEDVFEEDGNRKVNGKHGQHDQKHHVEEKEHSLPRL